ncbi:MAG: CAP domain-containing protein, partial [Methanomicrobiales archaeon]|nr:CAP domain-containing protein [Methanomicrobiales archaeon]
WYAEGIGENINQMPTGNVIGYGVVNNDAESIGRATVTAFMNSPGHRANILKSQYSNLGVGVAYDGTYYYTTQNFW